MSARMKPILGALVTTLALGYAGVTFLFGPVMANDAPAGPMMPGWAALLLYSVVGVLFYDWVNQQVNAPVKAALILAIAQILLVDFYYVLNGTRGLAAAAASVVVLVVAWGAAGFVYGALLGDGDAGGAAA